MSTFTSTSILSGASIGKEDSEFQLKTAILSISLLKSSRYQTRDAAFYSYEELQNLANSIKTIGLLELPRVRKDPDDPVCYEIISGHRRIQAVSKFLGWKKIRCEIYEKIDEFYAFRLNIAENLQRYDLSAYEEGVAYLLCHRLFGFSDEEIARQLHKSRQTVSTKRELAIAANQYVKYVEPPHANSFLRHFSLGHKEILSKLVTEQTTKQAVNMIARGASVRHLQRFIDLFTDESHVTHAEINRSTNTIGADNSLSPVEEVLSLFEQMKKEVPKKFVSRLNNLQEKYLTAGLGTYRVSEGSEISENRIFNCPTCKEAFEVNRRLIPEKDRVLFTIKQNKIDIKPMKFEYMFPIFYKIKSSL